MASSSAENPLGARLALAALMLAILIAVVAAVGMQISLEQLGTMSEERGKARDARIGISQLLSLFKDLETGARGFALTGEDAFLEPYIAARSEIPSAYAQVRVSVREMPGFSWPDLDALVQERMQLAEEVVRQRRASGAPPTGDHAILTQGRTVMDRLRQSVRQLDDRQLDQVVAYSYKVRDLQRNTAVLSWLATLSIIGLIVASTYLLLTEREARRKLAAALSDANVNLETHVAARTQELEEARLRLANFAVGLEDSIEAERRRIAREVHDQIGAVFTGIKLIVRGLPPGSLPTDHEKALIEAVDMGVVTARRIAAELRPPLLDDLGLQPALERLLESTFHGSKVLSAVSLKEAGRLSERQSLGIYRIVQEASTNVVRHAAARHFAVNGAPAGGQEYVITMMDDGVGMTPSEMRPGALGITGMRERAELLGGNLAVTAQAPGGSGLSVRLPLDPPRS